MSYIHTFSNHTQAVVEAGRPIGVTATMQLGDSALHLSDGRNSQVWMPKYMASLHGRTVYLPARSADVVGFAGWMPYRLRQWPTALDKIAFKRFAIANGIATPLACFDPARIGGPFIVKQANGSFGEGIRGPYLEYLPGESDHALADGEYYENFVVGHIAKAWCWGGECIALHLDQPTIVTGDGQSSVRDLVAKLPNSRGDINDWELVARLAAYCGIASIDSVLPAGKEVLVEFRYGSRYEVTARQGNPNQMPQLRETDLGRQFTHAAEVLAGSISPDEATQRRSFFTLDAVVDEEGKAWFLEMNCNPLVHPDLYGPMMASLFSAVATDAVADRPDLAVALEA